MVVLGEGALSYKRGTPVHTSLQGGPGKGAAGGERIVVGVEVPRPACPLRLALPQLLLADSGVLRDQICIAQGLKVNCVGQDDF